MRMLTMMALFALVMGWATTYSYGMIDGPEDVDNTPIQAGYAVVTPTSANTAGLVVFGTFGERRGKDTPQAGVLPSSYSDHFLLYVNMHGRLSRNLGVAVANPGATNASVTLTLRDEGGIQAADPQIVPVDAGHQVAKMVTELFPDQATVPQGFVGTLDISSDVPVAVIGLRFRGMNFSTLPATNLGEPSVLPAAGGIGGPGSVILAHFVTGGGWATEVVLVNSGAEALTVRVDLFAQSGVPLTAQMNGTAASSFPDITIPAGGVTVLSQRNQQGDSDF